MVKIKNAWLLFGLFAFCILVYLLSSTITPFLFAAFLAYITDPIVTKLVELEIPRIIGVIIVFSILLLAIVLLLLFLLPLLEKQIALLIKSLPQIAAWIQEKFVKLSSAYFGIKENINTNIITDLLEKNWKQAGDLATYLWKTMSYSGYSFIIFITNLLLVPVVTFYLLRDWDKLINGIHKVIPASIEPHVVPLIKQCDEVLGAFFRGQLFVMLSLGVFYSISLWIVGLNLALLIGLIIGLISIVPYLGFFAGISITLLATVVQFQDWTHLVYVVIVFIIGQMLESMLLTPMLVGNRIGLHPVAVIFAILAGGQLFGFLGVLLALPAAAIIMVLLRYANARYLESNFYRKPG